MLRIGICDDEEVICDLIEFFINEYALKNGLTFSVGKYNSGRALLDSNIKFDIAFLDVSMPGINGIELGRLLRNENRGVKIIYISAYPEYAVEAFEVRASSYLLKPINKGKFFEVVEEVMGAFDLSKSKAIIHIKKHLFHANEVVYLKGTRDHRIVVRTRDEELNVRGELKDIVEEIQRYGFTNPRRGIWINPLYIQKRMKKTCI